MGWFALIVAVFVGTAVMSSSRDAFPTNLLLGVISFLLLIILLRDLNS